MPANVFANENHLDSSRNIYWNSKYVNNLNSNLVNSIKAAATQSGMLKIVKHSSKPNKKENIP